MPMAPRRRHTGATRAPGHHLKVDVAGATCATQALRVRYTSSQVEPKGLRSVERYIVRTLCSCLLVPQPDILLFLSTITVCL